jgi:hypothetical protein
MSEFLCPNEAGARLRTQARIGVDPGLTVLETVVALWPDQAGVSNYCKLTWPDFDRSGARGVIFLSREQVFSEPVCAGIKAALGTGVGG